MRFRSEIRSEALGSPPSRGRFAKFVGGQAQCLREIERHEQADQSYMDEGIQILELAQNAQRLFERQVPREKRRLLGFLLSNCTWHDGEVVPTFRQPFDLLAETLMVEKRKKAAGELSDRLSEIWLRGQDSNLRPGG